MPSAVARPTAPRLRTLLALLLVRAENVVPIEELVDELWGPHPPADSANALHASVSRLRRVLAPMQGAGHPGQVVRRSPGGYAIRIAAEQLDVRCFERLAAAGTRLLAEGNAEAAARTLRAALALWRGSALAGVPTGELLHAQASGLEEARLTALEQRVEADLQLSRHRDLVAELHMLVASHPLRETFWRQLMLALYRSGRQAEALAAYRRLRRSLVSELGLEPGLAVRRLHDAILAGKAESEAGRPGRPVVTSQLPTAVADFAGRQGLLAALLRASFAASYLAIGPGDRQAFRLMTLCGAGHGRRRRCSLRHQPVRGRGDTRAARRGRLAANSRSRLGRAPGVRVARAHARICRGAAARRRIGG